MNGKSKRYDDKFKEQIAKIYNQGNHTYRSLSEEYGVSTAALRSWVTRYNQSKSFDIKENRIEEEKALIKLQKENQQLRMENDILYPEGHTKQAALLLGKK